jgi:hypothetical protein
MVNLGRDVRAGERERCRSVLLVNDPALGERARWKYSGQQQAQ